MFGEKRKQKQITITPQQLVIMLRDPDCDSCPFWEECIELQNEMECIMFKKAADCIENLLKKGN